MSRKLKSGDRVRVTKRSRAEGYEPGDKGTVVGEPIPAPSGRLYYLVAMDKGNSDRTGTVFTDEEIEADEE